jgi:putative SOS response-associated peptidase YedK
MCGRYTLTLNPDQLAVRFGLEPSEALQSWEPRYNISPTQRVAIVTDALPNKLTLAHWGLIPTWSQDNKIASQLINARSETVAEKPTFRNAFKKRRCLVLADGFYEWQSNADGTTRGKTPIYIYLKDNPAFAMAGLWEMWKPKTAPDTEWRTTFTILTTQPNEMMAQVHNRMPVILPKARERDWLNPAGGEIELFDLMRPIPSELMTMHIVSPRVNTSRVDSPDLIERAQA